jgi:hypothetical protein
MEVSGQRHMTALIRGEEPAVLIEQEDVRTPEPVWTQ